MSISHPSVFIDPHLEELLRGAVALGALLVLLLPEARGHNAAIGWLPLWLLGMPLASWWALHRFRLPRHASGAENESAPRRRRREPQARRRPSTGLVRRPRAA